MTRRIVNGTAKVITLVADGRTSWKLNLEVWPYGADAYRVSGRFRMPRLLQKLRLLFGGAARIAVGAVLPVAIEPSDPQQVEILWSELTRSPRGPRLHEGPFTLKAVLRDFPPRSD